MREKLSTSNRQFSVLTRRFAFNYRKKKVTGISPVSFEQYLREVDLSLADPTVVLFLLYQDR